MTAQRLSDLSCDETEFKKAATQYEEVLKRSGYNEKLVYTPKENRASRRIRQRDILWYTSPFDRQVKTNVGHTFLKLIDRHFPPNHRLRALLNRNSFIVSYSCMQNVNSAISSHNRKVLNQPTTPARSCNCTDRTRCPLDGKCLTTALVYGSAVTADDESGNYVGISEPPFKSRRSDHRTSFNDRRYENKTDLSKKVWELRDKGKLPHISWSIIRKSTPYVSGSNHCNLCLWEKYHIMKGENLINKRDELVSTCRHVNKFLLKNFKNRNRDND